MSWFYENIVDVKNSPLNFISRGSCLVYKQHPPQRHFNLWQTLNASNNSLLDATLGTRYTYKKVVMTLFPRLISKCSRICSQIHKHSNFVFQSIGSYFKYLRMPRILPFLNKLSIHSTVDKNHSNTVDSKNNHLNFIVILQTMAGLNASRLKGRRMLD